MSAFALLLQVAALGVLPQLAAPVRRVPTVLRFPDPVLDDTSSYQGYRTRFFRDSKRNALQIYMDARSGRVVHLWADAVNESVGFTIRRDSGDPPPLSWASDEATVGDSSGTRWLEHSVSIAAPSVEIGWFVLGSMRVERDFQYWKWHLRPYTDSAFHLNELSALIAALGRLDPAEQPTHLALLRAKDAAELRSRLEPTVSLVQQPGGAIVRVVQPSFDTKNRMTLELRVDPKEASFKPVGRTVTIVARGAQPIRLRVRVSTNSGALSPLDRNEIFNAAFLQWVASGRARRDSLARAAARGARVSSAELNRQAWLERQLVGAELLTSREKLMAGLPNFATYFGRDGMMTALMMRPVWSPGMTEHVIASVLRKLSPDGLVSHEEALGGQAIREAASEYASLVDQYVRAKGSGAANADSLLARARGLLVDMQRVRENYSMLDDKFQFPVLVSRWIADPGVSSAHKREFLLDAKDSGEPRIVRLARALEVVARLSAPYARDAVATNLVSFAPVDSGRWRSASWRDSGAGYANGRFAMDINAIWVPEALRGMEVILQSLRALGLASGSQIQGAGAGIGPNLSRYVSSLDSLRAAIRAWNGAESHFVVSLSPEQVRDRARAKLTWLPENEQAYWERVESSGGAPAALEFLAISLDSAGHPIGVMSTDPATRLFLSNALGGIQVSERAGEGGGVVSAGNVVSSAALRDVRTLMRRFPEGLFVDGLGPLAANDAYASPVVWERFHEDSYHGPRVVWGREVNLVLAGLSKQLSLLYDASGKLREPGTAPQARELADALERTNAAVASSGMEHAELWSYRIENGRLLPTRYGFSSDVQLWNTTNLAVQFAIDGLRRRGVLR